MELLLKDIDFKSIANLDTFKSIIWTDRYFGIGDFDITTYASSSIVAYLAMGRYLCFRDSEHIMIIEDLWIHSDNDAGNTIIIQGRSLESILDRRIVWGQTILSGSFENAILQLLNENVINPTDTTRKINNFVFEPSGDEHIESLNVKAQFVGDNLYTAIEDLCISANVGFKITLSSTGNFIFKLYYSTDRSYSQIENPFVVFSPKFENIDNSDFKLSSRTLKTIALVAGEGEEPDRTKISIALPEGPGSGLNRREIYTDAGDITSNTPEGPISPEDYLAHLTQRGAETLAQYIMTQTFEGQVYPSKTFVYNTDFFLGDIVQVADEYGNKAKSRVNEVIYSQDSTGIHIYPTFSTIT